MEEYLARYSEFMTVIRPNTISRDKNRDLSVGPMHRPLFN